MHSDVLLKCRIQYTLTLIVILTQSHCYEYEPNNTYSNPEAYHLVSPFVITVEQYVLGVIPSHHKYVPIITMFISSLLNLSIHIYIENIKSAI